MENEEKKEEVVQTEVKQEEAKEETTKASPSPKEVFSKEDIEKTKSVAMWAYVVFFIPLIAESCKNSNYARFHTNQGLILLITSIVGNIAISILGSLLWFLFWLWPIVSFAWWVTIVVFVIKSMISVKKGEAKQLPLVGKFKIIK